MSELEAKSQPIGLRLQNDCNDAKLPITTPYIGMECIQAKNTKGPTWKKVSRNKRSTHASPTSPINSNTDRTQDEKKMPCFLIVLLY
jgi:hypothetical protein